MVTAAIELEDTCFLEGKLWKKLDSILKSKDITLPTKVHIVEAMVFSVVTFECECWIINKAECWRIDAFEMWCWRRLLRVPWTAGRSKQSIWSHSVVSDSSRPHGLQPTRPLHPWDLPGKSTGVGCHCLLQILKEINPKYSLEELILTLKL